MAETSPNWHLIGAGHIGTLAAYYLTRAGHRVTVLRPTHPPYLDATLRFAAPRHTERLRLPVAPPASLETPVSRLLLACKTPYTANALARVTLAEDAVVLRLQNGIGSLDGLLPTTVRVIEAVTTSAVTGADGAHEVVAENETWMGGLEVRPAWFDRLGAHWPGLRWSDDIRRRQYAKLVANAAINPLTALYDVPNGRLLEDPALRQRMAALVAEADTLLHALDTAWPGDSLAVVQAIARATAANTSSMRADVQRGAPTEIDVINGWLLRQAEHRGIALPTHAAIVAALATGH